MFVILTKYVIHTFLIEQVLTCSKKCRWMQIKSGDYLYNAAKVRDSRYAERSSSMVDSSLISDKDGR